jgi:serine/threonine-protein kinase RsbW
MKNFNTYIILKSHSSQFYKLEQFVDTISDNYNIIHSFFSNIITVLAELVENAIVHGNNNNKEKNIIIEFEESDGHIIFSVTDQGDGFKYDAELNKIIQMDDTMGTGLYLAKTLSDNIEFLNDGRTVKVMFDLSTANELLSQTRRQILSETHIESKKTSHEQ